MSTRQPPICDYEGSDYQTSFWDQGGRTYEDRVEAVALRRLLPAKGKILLEVGAGAGRNTQRYQGFKQVVLLDYSHSQLKQAQERLGRGGRYIYVAASVYILPFVEGLFDAATMIRTLHHMANAPAALRQVHQVLQCGGVFILEYANKRNLKAILRYVFRRQPWNPFSLEPIEFATLNYNFHPKTVRKWMHESGFSIKRQLTVSHFRVDLLKRALPVQWLVAMDSIAQWTGNWWQLSPSVFIRAEATGDTPSAAPGILFKCIECGKYPLTEKSDRLVCPACSHEWEILDGIYIFK